MSNTQDSASYYIRHNNHLYGPLPLDRITYCLGRKLFVDSDEISSDQLQWKSIKTFTAESKKLPMAIRLSKKPVNEQGQTPVAVAQPAIPIRKKPNASVSPSVSVVPQPGAGFQQPGSYPPGAGFQQPGGYPPGAGFQQPGGYPPPAGGYPQNFQPESAKQTKGNSMVYAVISLLLVVVSIVIAIAAGQHPSSGVQVIQIIISLVLLILSISGVISGSRHKNTGGFVLNLILLILWIISFIIGFSQAL